MITKIMTTIGSLMVYSSLATISAFAESGESHGSVIGMIGGAVVGAILVLTPLIMMSKTKKQAKEANNYIKEEAGGYSEITSRKDTYIRTDVEHKSSN